MKPASEGATTQIIPAPIYPRNIKQSNAAGSHPPAVLTPGSWLPVTPFRWVEIEGWPGELSGDWIVRRAAFAKGWNDEASSFECSNPLLNRIWDLCKYSIKATTFAGVDPSLSRRIEIRSRENSNAKGTDPNGLDPRR